MRGNWYHILQSPADVDKLPPSDGYVLKFDITLNLWVASPITNNGYEKSFTNADLSTGILTVNHALGKKYNIVQVYDNSYNQITPDQITLTDTNNCSVDLSSWGPISGTWYCVVIAGVN